LQDDWFLIEAASLKAKGSVALTRSGGRQIQQLARHE
jgi:hypothetical protein